MPEHSLSSWHTTQKAHCYAASAGVPLRELNRTWLQSSDIIDQSCRCPIPKDRSLGPYEALNKTMEVDASKNWPLTNLYLDQVGPVVRISDSIKREKKDLPLSFFLIMSGSNMKDKEPQSLILCHLESTKGCRVKNAVSQMYLPEGFGMWWCM